MLIGWLLSRPRVVDWMIERAKKTPYFHLDGYMQRYWLFNPYDEDRNLPRYKWCPWSFRLQYIMRADESELMHNHPWNAWSVILRGFYIEMRGGCLLRVLTRGKVNRLRHRDFHRIFSVSPDGCWTLFITGPKISSWGYFIPWRDKHAFDSARSVVDGERRGVGVPDEHSGIADRRDRR